MGASVVIEDGDTRIRFHSVKAPGGGGYEYKDFSLDVEAAGLTASTEVTHVEGGEHSLSRFFDQLAAAWKGWRGDRRWDALEGGMSIAAAHDGTGHVTLEITIRENPYPEAWEVKVTLSVGAGEELAQIAKDVRAFFSS